jgi:hypothetical protein
MEGAPAPGPSGGGAASFPAACQPGASFSFQFAVLSFSALRFSPYLTKNLPIPMNKIKVGVMEAATFRAVVSPNYLARRRHPTRLKEFLLGQTENHHQTG